MEKWRSTQRKNVQKNIFNFILSHFISPHNRRARNNILPYFSLYNSTAGNKVTLFPAKKSQMLKCDKIKIKLGINREKSGFIHLGELSTSVESTFCVRRICAGAIGSVRRQLKCERSEQRGRASGRVKDLGVWGALYAPPPGGVRGKFWNRAIWVTLERLIFILKTAVFSKFW